MEQPKDTQTTKSGDGYITEADMAAYLTAGPEIKSKYAEELKNGGANVFFKKVLQRESAPPTIYPLVHNGITVLPYPGTVTEVDGNSSYSVEIARGLKLFVEGTRQQYALTDRDCTSLYFNSITRWDGTKFGGANCAMIGNYPHWPYILIKTLTRVTKGQELLIDYQITTGLITL